ncbi:MAG: RNA-binding protein [Deltaproteobacteria bacterium]|nr:RNA-binding protein [Deltaproteobacteria bacterium]
MATKLFVGNLSFNTTEEGLETLFRQVGTVEAVQIITDKATGRSRGFGFVEMADRHEAQVAIERFHEYEFQGRPLTVNEAKPKTERSGDRRPSSGGGRTSFGRGDRGWGRESAGRERRW